MAKGEKKDDKKDDKKKKDKIDEYARDEIQTRSKVEQAGKDYAKAQRTIQDNMAAGRKTPQKVFQARYNAEEVLKRYPEHVSPFSPKVRDENRQEYPDEPGEPDELQVKNTTKTPATNLRGRDETDVLGVAGQADYETQREKSRLDEEGFFDDEPGLSDPNNLFFRQLRDEEDIVAPLPNTSIDQLRANAARAQADRVPTTPRLSKRAVGPFTPTVNQSSPPSSSSSAGRLYNSFRSSVKKVLTGDKNKDPEETLPLVDDTVPPGSAGGGPVDPPAVDPTAADPEAAAGDPVKPVDPTAADLPADTSFQGTPPDPVQQALIDSLREQVSRNAQASALQQAQLDQTRSQVLLLLSKQQTVDQAAITKLELRQELARSNNNNNERWYPRPGQFSYMDLARQNRFRENYPPGARERYFRNIPARHRPLLQQEEEEVSLKRPAPELSSNKKRAKVSGKTMSKEKLTALIKLLLSEEQSEKLAQAKKQRKKPVKKNGVRGSLTSSHVS
jgi:hypothetical protein